MSRSMRTRAAAASFSCALALALALALGAGPAAAAVHYTKESQQAYEEQLAAQKIASVVINKRLRSVRITLKDGGHVLYRYPPQQEPRVAAELKAKHVSVTVLSKSAAQAEEEKGKTRGHSTKWKVAVYGGGAVLVLAVIGGAFLLFDRRRKRLAEE